MSIQPGRYIVTGGAGFIGSNVVAELQQRDPDAEILVIDSFRTGRSANLTDACRRRGQVGFTGTILPEPIAGLNWDDVVGAFEATAVFHLAAITDTTVEDESEMIRENAGDSWAWLLRVCAGNEIPLVYASSAATYGTPPHAARREAFPLEAAGQPNNVYGFSKWLMEKEHDRLNREVTASGDPAPWVVGLRYFNVFGPGEGAKGKMASMAWQLANQLLDGQRPRLFEDGSQTRDQVPVEDIVGMTLAGAGLGDRSNPEPGVYNAGSGIATSFEEVATACRLGLGLDSSQWATEYFEMPANIARFYQDFTLADMSRTVSGLGYRSTRTPAEAIQTYAKLIRDERENA